MSDDEGSTVKDYATSEVVSVVSNGAHPVRARGAVSAGDLDDGALVRSP